jgi:hypothetical protein
MRKPLFVLENTLTPNEVTVEASSCSKFALVRALQYLNAESPIVVTFAGIVMLVSLEQDLNASLPIIVRFSGSSTLVSPVQLWNAWLSIVLTLSGIVMLVKLYF